MRHQVTPMTHMNVKCVRCISPGSKGGSIARRTLHTPAAVLRIFFRAGRSPVPSKSSQSAAWCATTQARIILVERARENVTADRKR